MSGFGLRCSGPNRSPSADLRSDRLLHDRLRNGRRRCWCRGRRRRRYRYGWSGGSSRLRTGKDSLAATFGTMRTFSECATAGADHQVLTTLVTIDRVALNRLLAIRAYSQCHTGISSAVIVINCSLVNCTPLLLSLERRTDLRFCICWSSFSTSPALPKLRPLLATILAIFVRTA